MNLELPKSWCKTRLALLCMSRLDLCNNCNKVRGQLLQVPKIGEGFVLHCFCFSFSVKSASDLTSQNAQNRGSISPSSHIIFTRVQPSLPTFNSAVLQLFIAPKAPTHRCGKSGYKLVTEFDSYSDDGVSAVIGVQHTEVANLGASWWRNLAVTLMMVWVLL